MEGKLISSGDRLQGRGSGADSVSGTTADVCL